MKRTDIMQKLAALLIVSLCFGGVCLGPLPVLAVESGRASDSNWVISYASPSDGLFADTPTAIDDPADATSSNWGTDPLYDPNVLEPTPITYVRVYDIKTLYFLEQGTSSASLEPDTPLISLYPEGSSRPQNIPFEIVYDTAGFDEDYAHMTGLHMLAGTIQLLDHQYMLPDALADISIPVFVYSLEHPQELPYVTDVTDLTTCQIILPVGSSWEDCLSRLETSNQELYITMTHDNETYEAVVSCEWVLADPIDFDTPGIYQISAQPDLPEGVLIPEDWTDFLCCNVNIQSPDQMTLSTPYVTKWGLITSMLYSIPKEDLDQVRCWYRVDDGPWTESCDTDFMELHHTLSSGEPLTSLYLYRDQMEELHTYQFQLEYNNMFSNVLEVIYDGYSPRFGLIQGDRDGGDRGEQTLPYDPTEAPDNSSDDTGGSEEKPSEPAELPSEPAEPPSEPAEPPSEPAEDRPSETRPDSDSSSGGTSSGSSSAGGSSGSSGSSVAAGSSETGGSSVAAGFSEASGSSESEGSSAAAGSSGTSSLFGVADSSETDSSYDASAPSMAASSSGMSDKLLASEISENTGISNMPQTLEPSETVDESFSSLSETEYDASSSSSGSLQPQEDGASAYAESNPSSSPLPILLITASIALISGIGLYLSSHFHKKEA